MQLSPLAIVSIGRYALAFMPCDQSLGHSSEASLPTHIQVNIPMLRQKYIVSNSVIIESSLFSGDRRYPKHFPDTPTEQQQTINGYVTTETVLTVMHPFFQNKDTFKILYFYPCQITYPSNRSLLPSKKDRITNLLTWEMVYGFLLALGELKCYG